MSVSSSVENLGMVVASTGFSCPSDAPNPVAGIRLAGGSGAVTVTARITGTTKLPDGSPSAYDVTLGGAQVEVSGEGMELYSLCRA